MFVCVRVCVDQMCGALVCVEERWPLFHYLHFWFLHFFPITFPRILFFFSSQLRSTAHPLLPLIEKGPGRRSLVNQPVWGVTLPFLRPPQTGNGELKFSWYS